jgi:hypothetical protein
MQQNPYVEKRKAVGGQRRIIRMRERNEEYPDGFSLRKKKQQLWKR